MSARSHGRLATVAVVAQLALHSALLRLTEPVTGLLDFWFSGLLGVEAQAAVGMGATMMTAAAWLTGPLLFAQTTAVGGLHAAGEHDQVRRELRSALGSALTIGLGACIVMLIISVSGIVHPETSPYLMIRAFAIPFTAVSMAIWGSFRGTGKTWLAAVLALVATAVHGTLAAVLVDSLGVIGLGVAGVFAQALGAMLSLIFARRLRLLACPAKNTWAGTSLGNTQILLMMRSSSLGVATMLMAFSASSVGTVPGAAYQLTYQLWIIFIMVADGWRAAGQVVLARSVSVAEQKRFAKFLIWASTALGTMLALIFLAVLPSAQSIFSGSPAIAEALSPLWPWAASAIWCAAVAFVLDGLDYGRGQFARNLWRTLIGTAFWVLGALVSAITGTTEVLWIGVTMGFATRIFINVITSGRGR